jgi:hypothetical protein
LLEVGAATEKSAPASGEKLGPGAMDGRLETMGRHCLRWRLALSFNAIASATETETRCGRILFRHFSDSPHNRRCRVALPQPIENQPHSHVRLLDRPERRAPE